MKHFLRSLLILVLILCFSENAQSFNPKLAAMLQDSLNYYVSQISNIKGMSASVYIPGQGLWQGTSGLSHSGQVINSNMKFGIASNTKLFVASIIMKLQENGQLNLNDKLSKWLPNYKNVNPNITIRQLLNHTSGVSDPIFLSPWMDTIKANPTRVFTHTEVLSWLGAAKFSPGTGWFYSNVNYILAGMIAQNVTNFPISKLIRDSILTPLNMNNTFYDVDEAVSGVLAHRWYNNIDFHDTSRVGLNSAGDCAGSLFSTSSDMALWYHNLFSAKIINKVSLAELTTFVSTGNPDYDYGLGLDRSTTLGVDYWGHGGSTWGYKSKMIYDSCMGTVVCGLSNSFPAGMDGVTFILYRIVFSHVPKCAANMTGSTNVCQGQSSVLYSVPAISGASSYVWTLPNGASGSSNSNSITVNFGQNAKSGTIMVSGVNEYGEGGNSSLYINVSSTPASATAISGPNKICIGKEAYTYSVPSIENASSYIWSLPSGATGSSTTNSITITFDSNAVSGNLSVKAINSCGEGLASSMQININRKYNFIESKSICNGETYSWHGKNYTSANTYTENYTSINGCDSNYTLNLKVFPKYNISEEKSICNGETYSWHGKNYTSANTYTENYTSINGCDSIHTLILKVFPNYNFQVEKRICKGETYNWHGKNYGKSGEYTLKNTSINGCDSSYKLNLTVDTITTSVSKVGKSLVADSLADQYQWFDCDKAKIISGEIASKFTPTKSGNYAVILTRDNCTDTSTCMQFTFSDIESDDNSFAKFSIFPNPASSSIFIKSHSETISEFELVNVLGQILKNGIINDEIIDVNNLAIGIYYLKIENSMYKILIAR